MIKEQEGSYYRRGPLELATFGTQQMSSATEKFRRVAEAAATVAINLARPNYFSSSEKGTVTMMTSAVFSLVLRRDV
jgi:hypothetical protein